MTQNTSCLKHDINQFHSTFDIIDKELLKLVEVKVTKDPARARAEYEEKSMGNFIKTALVLINPNIQEITYINHHRDLLCNEHHVCDPGFCMDK